MADGMPKMPTMGQPLAYGQQPVAHGQHPMGYGQQQMPQGQPMMNPQQQQHNHQRRNKLWDFIRKLPQRIAKYWWGLARNSLSRQAPRWRQQLLGFIDIQIRLASQMMMMMHQRSSQWYEGKARRKIRNNKWNRICKPCCSLEGYVPVIVIAVIIFVIGCAKSIN